MKVVEAGNWVYDYLKKRNIMSQYLSAKTHIQERRYQQVDLKIRKPKKDKIYQFKINKKYRAFAEKQNGKLIVFSIFDHQ